MTILLRLRLLARAMCAPVLAAALLLGAAPAMAQTAIRFTLDGRFEGPSALFLAALDKGYFKAEGLDVTIDAGNGSRDGVSRVASGAYEMGVGDVNSLIRFRDENPASDMKAVMILHDTPLFSIVGRKSRGITTDLKSFAGKKFGAPAAELSYGAWPILKELNSLDDSGMRFENIGFPVREPMLASGEVDAVFGFSTTIFVNLKSRGVPVDDITLVLMADHGVALYGNAIVVAPKFMAENPEAVRGFVRALVRGIKDVVANQGEGIASVLKRNEAAMPEVEAERLKMTLEQHVMTPWTRANGIGGIEKLRWERALDQLGLAYSFKDRAKAGDAFDDSFLPLVPERMF